MYRYLFVLPLLLFFGCTQKSEKHLNGKILIQKKCATCHNMDLPPLTYKEEKAPPMMAVAFHLKAFVPAQNESDKIPNAITFVKDYVINPSASKSYCDKASLHDYGVMPSQKGKVTPSELQAIGEFMFEHFTQKNLMDAQNLQNRLDAMPKGQRLALKYGCLSCHKRDRDLVGPSFKKITTYYKGKRQTIITSIKNGSQGKWKNSHGALMPKFKTKLTPDELNNIATWIVQNK